MPVDPKPDPERCPKWNIAYSLVKAYIALIPKELPYKAGKLNALVGTTLTVVWLLTTLALLGELAFKWHIRVGSSVGIGPFFEASAGDDPVPLFFLWTFMLFVMLSMWILCLMVFEENMNGGRGK